MNNLIVMCPSRSRPTRLMKLVESFEKTIQGEAELVIYLDNDDPKLKNYPVDELRLKHEVLIGNRMDVSKTYNFLVNKYKKYKYYCAINDDMVFITPGWDKILINEIIEDGAGWGIAFGEDNIHSGKDLRPTNHVVSGNIIRTLGFIYPPSIYHLYGDIFLQDLGKHFNFLFYCPKVIIEHNHWVNYKSNLDEVYNYANSRNKEELAIYNKYLATDFIKDCQKITYAISNNNKVLRTN